MLIVFVLVMISACTRTYEDEAGLYELYELSGDIEISDIDYYYIQLSSEGEVLIKFKINSSDYEEQMEVGTFKIRGSEVKIYTKIGFTRITKTYDFINGEIHMNDVELEGYDLSYSAKFRKTD